MTDPYNPNPEDPNAGRRPGEGPDFTGGPGGQDPYAAPGQDPYAAPAHDPYASPAPYPGQYASVPPGGAYPAPGSFQPPAAVGTNRLAITSLVCGIVGFLCCGILSVVGLVTGVIAMKQVKETGQGGHGLALAGTIVSGVSLVVGILFAIISFGS